MGPERARIKPGRRLPASGGCRRGRARSWATRARRGACRRCSTGGRGCRAGDAAVDFERRDMRRVERRRAARHHPQAAVERNGRQVRRDDRKRAAQIGDRRADALGMRDGLAMCSVIAPVGAAAPRTRGRTPACRAARTGRRRRSGRARSGRSCSVDCARTRSRPRSSASAADRRERAAMHLAEVLARDVDDREVDLDQRDRLDRRVLQQLLGRAAVAAADDQRRLRRWDA